MTLRSRFGPLVGAAILAVLTGPADWMAHAAPLHPALRSLAPGTLAPWHPAPWHAAPHAQPQRPRAEVTPVVVTSPVRADAVTRLSLRVRLPKDIHVQSNKPRDPLLIPTVLSLEPPAGLTVDAIEYPKATDLAQPGRKDPLAVYGSEFEIGVKVTLGKGVSQGPLVVPALLRYQACNDTVCFPPARAATQWTLVVQP